jgi:hypothetical protein
MNQLVPINSSPKLPALVAAASERASMRFLEFFAANIRDRTRAGPITGRQRNSLSGARA